MLYTIIDPSAQKTGSQIDFDYTSAVQNAYIELPVFYYVGLKAYTDCLIYLPADSKIIRIYDYLNHFFPAQPINSFFLSWFTLSEQYTIIEDEKP